METKLYKRILNLWLGMVVFLVSGVCGSVPVVNELKVVGSSKGIALSISADALFDAQFAMNGQNILDIVIKNCVYGLNSFNYKKFEKNVPIKNISAVETENEIAISVEFSNKYDFPLKVSQKGNRWLVLVTNSKTHDFSWHGYGKSGTFSIDSLNNNNNDVNLEKIAVLQRDNVCKLSFVFDGKTEKKIRQTADSLLILFKGAFNSTGKDRYDLPNNLLFESVNLKEKTYDGIQWLGAAVKLGSKIDVTSFSTTTLSGQMLVLYMKTENRNISLWTSDNGSEWDYPFYEGQQYSVNMDSLSMKAQRDVKKVVEPKALFAVNGNLQSLSLKSVKNEDASGIAVQKNMKTLVAENVNNVQVQPISEPASKPEINKQFLFASQDFINVRSGPSMKSNVVDQLKTGNKLEVIQKQGVWVNVVYDSKKGWVHNSLLVSDNTLASVNAEKTIEVPLVNEPTESVKKVSLQLPQKNDLEKEHKIKYRGGGRDPFVPLISDTVSESGMPLIENLRLVGILFGNEEKIALLEDIKTQNRPFALREEDKVDNGKLLKIYKNKVVFLITEFGISRSLTMTLSSLSDREARN